MRRRRGVLGIPQGIISRFGRGGALPDPPIPDPPANLAAVAAGNDEIDCTWDASSGADLYRLQYSLNGISGWADVGTTASTGLNQTGLDPGQTVWYRVRAENASGASAYSGIDSATTTSGFLPSDLANLIGWWKGDAGVTLTSGRISGLADQSSAGNDLSQATAGDRPVVDAAGRNGTDTIRHNGDWLARAALVGGTLTKPVSYVWWHQQAAISYGLDAGGSTPGGAQKAFLYGDVTSTVLITAGTLVEPDAVWTLPTRWAMDVAVFNGASSVYWRDGYKVNNFNPGDNTTDGITLGASYLGTGAGNGDTGELLLISGDVTADPDFAQLAPYGWARWQTPSFRVIFADRYEDFPGHILLDNGELFTYWRSATGHLGPDGIIKGSRSVNDGDSWTPAFTIYEETDANLQQNNTVVQLASGALLLGFWRSQPSDGTPLTAHVLRSTDRGQTWDLYADIPIPSGYTWVAWYGRMVELTPGGRILGTFQSAHNDGHFDALLFYSDDHGATWALLSVAALGDVGASEYWTEWSILPQTTINHLLGVVRNDSGSTLHLIYSTDAGATWTTPVLLGYGISPDLLRLADNRILLSYTQRGDGGFAGDRFRLSDDDGVTWSDPHTLYVAWSPDVGHGYPSAQQLADDSISWTKGDRVPSIVHIRMALGDLG